MKFYYTSIIFLLFVVFSCKKEIAVESYDSDIDKATVYAGEIDTSLFCYSFVSPMSIEVVYDSMNLYGHGVTNIDIDFNGVPDLSFSLDLLNHDSIHLLNGNPPNPFPKCSLAAGTNLSIALNQEELFINGSTTTVFWCDTIQHGEEIGTNQEWSALGSELDLWRNINGSPTGSWMEADGLSYLGFKLNDKYGWLEIDVSNAFNPLLVKFAIQR